jgi:adenine-specific DNA glycosylase
MEAMTPHQRKISAIVKTLLDWFSQTARDLPWRRTSDPYAIWVSEIMLEQTTPCGKFASTGTSILGPNELV